MAARKKKGNLWECKHCTTKNNVKSNRCAVCFQPRTNGKKSKNGYPLLNKSGNVENNILKCGALQKKGKGIFDGWSTRYFVLKQNGDFAYYSDKSCRNYRGNIDLSTVSKIARKDNKKFVYI